MLFFFDRILYSIYLYQIFFLYLGIYTYSVKLKMSKCRNLVFTLNNYTELDFNSLPEKMSPYKYLIYGKEKGEKGTPHLQGYIEFKNPRSFGALKKIDPRIHWEKRRGTALQASTYCKKEGDYTELGTMSRQGARTDIENVANAIIKGKQVSEVALEYPVEYIKYNRGIEKLHNIVVKNKSKDFRSVTVSVFYGKTGTGKTKKAIEILQPDYYKLDVANNVWFDGYEGETGLIIDDFYGWIKFGHLLNILDGHPLRLEVKGSFTYALWTNVILTSNKHPDTWYKDLTLDQQLALNRRINKVIEYK